MSKLDCVAQELLIMLSFVKKVEWKLGNDAQIIVEDVSLKNFGISLILFVTWACHISDDIEELDQ